MINRRHFTLAAAAPFLSVTRTQATNQPSVDFKWDGIELHDVDPQVIPFGAAATYEVITGEGFDDEGVRLNKRGGEWQDNPVTQSQYGMLLLAGYRANGWEENLTAAIANGRRIHANGEDHDGKTYFPYGFRMPLFGRDDMVLDPPWYSGMAQGQVLQFYSQLFQATGDSFWQDAAAGVFVSFEDVMNTDLPWWVNVDENANLWFEEYPFDPEQHVFNGHVFAIAGVYEYWRATGNEWAAQLTKGAIRTILDRKDDFRVEGHQSRYALGQPVQHDTYHTVHINQLLFLYAVTQDDRFAQTADDFADDSDLLSGGGTLSLPAGEYNTPQPVNASSLLTMAEDTTTVFDDPTVLTVTRRRSEYETRRVFYQVTDSQASEFWIEETAASRVKGMYLGSLLLAGTTRGTLMEYVPSRTFTLADGQYNAYPANVDDFTVDPEVLDVPADVTCQVSARVLITAVPYVRVEIEGADVQWVAWGDHFQR